MATTDEIKAPGLQWRARVKGERVPYWVARADLIKTGYRPKSVRLHYPDAAGIIQRCEELQAEMLEWAGGNTDRIPVYDGKLLTLFRLYETDEESPYRDLEQDTQIQYSHNIKQLLRRVGNPFVRDVTGADTQQWYKRIVNVEGLSKGYAITLIAVLKQALNYGTAHRFADCKTLREEMKAVKFGTGEVREVALIFDQLVAFRSAALAMGRPSAAMWVTFQYELGFRRRDVIGKWVKKIDPTTGSLVPQWRDGLTWKDIDKEGVLTRLLSKTKNTTGRKVEHRIANYPDLLALLEDVPAERRVGPIVINEVTGQPYTAKQCRKLFRRIARKAGIPDDIWNMDARAGSVTEAFEVGATGTDVMSHAGHTQLGTSRRYNRRTLAATTRVAQLRLIAREKTGGKDGGTDGEQP